MDTVAIELTADDVGVLSAQLPAGVYYDDGNLIVPVASEAAVAALIDNLPAYRKAALISYAADRRWRAETGGITVAGMAVATDDRSKMMIMGARLKADADPAFTTQWKTAAGFVTLDAVTIIAISDAVLAHVDACFSVEAAVIADIEAGAISSRQEVDARAWPRS